MTRDRCAKQAARRRRAATGEPYTLARRQVAGGGPPVRPGSARATFDGLLAEFRRRGWPLEVEGQPLDGAWRCYAGPVSVGVWRYPGEGVDPVSEDPDDPASYDVETAPTVHVSAPLAIDHGGPDVVDHVWVPAREDAVEAVDTIARLLADARAHRLEMLVDDASCGICGDRYPKNHLLQPHHRVPPLCPACVFDGDLLARTDVASLAYQIDRLFDADLGAAAGWAAVAVALTAVDPIGLHSRLEAAWRRTHTLYPPAEAWGDVSQWWLWGPTRGSLSGDGDPRPGLSLPAAVAGVEKAHPHLHDEVGHVLGEEMGATVDIDPAVWQVVLAYVFSFATQAADRPAHRPSWHVVGSWDNLPPGRLGEGWEVGGIFETVINMLGYRNGASEDL
jgi:hypothetical protein